MAFSTITNTVPAAATFNSAGTGKYVNANSVFGGPADFYQLSPVRKVKGKDGVSSITLMRYAEVAPVVAGDPRPYFRITTTIECHKDMPLVNVDSAQRQLDEHISVTTMTRQFNGEV